MEKEQLDVMRTASVTEEVGTQTTLKRPSHSKPAVCTGDLYMNGLCEYCMLLVTSRAVNGYPGVRVSVEQRVPGQ